MSPTSCLSSGISCSPVRRSTCMLVANRTVPNIAHTSPVFLQIKMKGKWDNTLNGFCISSLHSLSSNAQTRDHSKPSTLDLVSFMYMDRKHEHKCINQCSIPDGLHAFQRCYLARNLTLVLGSCTHSNSATNPFRCLCYTQTVIPLSYAAQISTTRDPDLANVRLSVSNVDHEVPQP